MANNGLKFSYGNLDFIIKAFLEKLRISFEIYFLYSNIRKLIFGDVFFKKTLIAFIYNIL